MFEVKIMKLLCVMLRMVGMELMVKMMLVVLIVISMMNSGVVKSWLLMWVKNFLLMKVGVMGKIFCMSLIVRLCLGLGFLDLGSVILMLVKMRKVLKM